MEHSIDSLALDFQNMDIRLTEMEEKIDKIDTKLTQVVDAILGNPLTKQGGFMHDMDVLRTKIEELEKKQRTYENFKNKITWTVGLIMGVAMLLQYIMNIYTNIKK
jgi:tetrahydromethanopterin S-methyltransferase subunit G